MEGPRDDHERSSHRIDERRRRGECAWFECGRNVCRSQAAVQSRSTTLRSELLIFKPPLYSMNPSLRNLFMKKFTRDRVVPTISASVSCDTFGKVR